MHSVMLEKGGEINLLTKTEHPAPIPTDISFIKK